MEYESRPGLGPIKFGAEPREGTDSGFLSRFL